MLIDFLFKSFRWLWLIETSIVNKKSLNKPLHEANYLPHVLEIPHSTQISYGYLIYYYDLNMNQKEYLNIRKNTINSYDEEMNWLGYDNIWKR